MFVRFLFLEGIHRSFFSKLNRSFGCILMNGKTVNSLFGTVFFQMVYTWHYYDVRLLAFSWSWAQATCRWSKYIFIGYLCISNCTVFLRVPWVKHNLCVRFQISHENRSYCDYCAWSTANVRAILPVRVSPSKIGRCTCVSRKIFLKIHPRTTRGTHTTSCDWGFTFIMSKDKNKTLVMTCKYPRCGC